MAEVFSGGQSAPLATTLTDLYACPANYKGVVTNVTVCNRAGAAGSFRISIARAGIADATNQYRRYDLAIAANDAYSITEGWLLAPTDVIRVYASSANMSFSCDVDLTGN